jgi:23S rRNA pseudouridine1911/1915/1917 synthase
MAHIGYPIVGDIKYGAPQSFKQRDIALHSYYLSVPHPVTGLTLTFTAPPPAVWEGRFGPEVVATAENLTKKVGRNY